MEKLRAAIRDIKDYPKPGIVFRDITPVLADPPLMRDIVREIVNGLGPVRIDAIAAIEARGFIFGSMLAHELKCAFIPVRKAGKLPFKTQSRAYSLEYGTAEVEMHVDAIKPGWRVLVHDDLVATGGTASAAARLVCDLGGELAGFSFLINLGFLQGAEALTREFGLKPHFLVEY